MRIVLSPNPYRDRGLRAAQAARKILKNAGVETTICLPFDLDGGSRVELPRHLEYEKIETALPGADLLVCFGGDGTILHSARHANEYGIPILGVNMGSVGFLAELEHSELSQLGRLGKGSFAVEERMMLDVSVLREGKQVFHDTALNDVALMKSALGRVLDIKLSCGQMKMTEFSGDGVLVSTPTGSTGYALSAGGPLIEPTAENLLVTPVCAHAVDARPVVLSAQRSVSIRLGKGSRKAAYLTVDGGKGFRFSERDTALVKKSDRVTRLARLSQRTFFDILHKKFGKG
ncbi:MAG: NAD(+)/NADH kinase [Oscillospiraceae bacterium]|nr:NAD(+)/NADH kinase [Oscillospiraceae bacterium]